MTTASVEIAGRCIGADAPTFIIAEIGCNHNGDIKLAKEMVIAAKKAGCDCVKFQTFTAELFCSERDKMFTYTSQGKQITEPMFEMFKRLEFDRDQWAELIQFCDNNDITFFTTIQDPPDLGMMLELGLQAIKVGSDDFDHTENLVKFAATGLPLIISKGLADEKEVEGVLEIVTEHTDKLVVLHCVSLYPASAEYLNLRQIPVLAARYPNIVWGFSDHSIGSAAAATAVALGAKVIEKHFTTDHNLAGPDHWFSANPAEMEELVQAVRTTEMSLGNGIIAPHPEELKSKAVMRRRIVAARDLLCGEELDDGNVQFKRAEQGLFLSDWKQIKGRKMGRDLQSGTGIELKDVSGPS